MKLFPAMWKPYGGRGPTKFVRDHSEEVYRLAPSSLFGIVPWGISHVYAGVSGPELLLQVGKNVGANGKGRYFFRSSTESTDSTTLRRMGPQENCYNRSLLKRLGRVTPEELVDASLFAVEACHRDAFKERMPAYLGWMFGLRTDSIDSKVEGLERRVESPGKTLYLTNAQGKIVGEKRIA